MYRAGLASHPVAAGPRGPAVGDRGPGARFAQDQAFAQKIKAFGLTGNVLVVTDNLDDNTYLSSRNLHDVLVLETREVDPVSLVRFKNVLRDEAAP